MWPVPPSEHLIENRPALARTDIAIQEVDQTVHLVAGEHRVSRQEMTMAVAKHLHCRVVDKVVEIAARLKADRCTRESGVDIQEIPLVVAHLLRWMEYISEATADESSYTVVDVRGLCFFPLLQLDDDRI